MIRLEVKNIFTTISGDYFEMQDIDSKLQFQDPDDENKRYSLLNEGRFHTGLLTYIRSILDYHKVEYSIEGLVNQYVQVDSIDSKILDGVELRDYQISAANKMLCYRRGVVRLPTGAGKTEVQLAVIKRLINDNVISIDNPAIVIVNSVLHMTDTWESRCKSRGIQCGCIGAGRRELDNPVLICVVDSLWSGIKKDDPDIISLLSRTKLISFDECHHLSSNTWTSIGEMCPAEYRYGLSGTPFEKLESTSYSDLILVGITGELICEVPISYLRKRGYVAEPIITLIPVNGWVHFHDWRRIYHKGVVDNENRNFVISEIANHLSSLGYKVLVSVQMISHGESLLKLIPNSMFAYGGSQVARHENSEIIRATEDQNELLKRFVSTASGSVLIASSIFDESVDIPAINAAIIAGAYRSYRKTLQRIGRALHSREGNNRVFVFDFVDNQHYYLRAQSKKRIQIYENEGFQIYRGFDYINSIIEKPINL